MPLRPGPAAMPERGARMPIRSGLLCAIAGAKTPEAETAAADARNPRRESAIACLPLRPALGRGSWLVAMIATSAPCAKPSALCCRRGAQKRLDLRIRQRPVVVEIRDDLLHEWLRQRDRALLVGEVIVENCESELLRAFALVGPFEAVPGQTLDLVMLVKTLAIDRDDETVDRALSLICLHGARPTPLPS